MGPWDATCHRGALGTPFGQAWSASERQLSGRSRQGSLLSPALPDTPPPPRLPFHTSRPPDLPWWLVGPPSMAAVASGPNAFPQSPLPVAAAWSLRTKDQPKAQQPGPPFVGACSSPGAPAFSDLTQVREEVSPPPGSPPRLTYPIVPGPPITVSTPLCCFLPSPQLALLLPCWCPAPLAMS